MAIHGSHFRRWMPWLLAVTVAIFALPRGFLGAAFGGRAQLRQLPLLLGPLAEAVGSCRDCCVADFCRCQRCECWQILRSLGYRTPLDVNEALKQGVLRAEALQWREASLPVWHPVADSQLEIRSSKIAGLGLFAAEPLEATTLLPPYQGLSLLNADLNNLDYTQDEDNYVWCPPDRRQSAGPMDPSFCVDGREVASSDNPARFVNGARTLEQCKEVNLEICELGEVAYFRTLKAIPVGSELLVDYGPGYWSDFGGCQ